MKFLEKYGVTIIKMDISNMFSKRTTLFILVLLSLFQNACFAEKTISQVFDNPPKNVLVGTDVKLLSLFKIAGHISSGTYVAEMGGAKLSMHITKNEDAFNLTRTFQESGMPKESKSYEIINTNTSYIDNNKILLVSVKNGILLLEKNSGSFGIPADMWIFYSKK